MALPDVTWRPGSFAERYPQEARDIGRAHKLEALANRLLYQSAGTVRPGSISDAQYGVSAVPYPSDVPPPGCCGATRCDSSVDSACARGTCTGCGPGEDDFEAIYPDAASALDEGHALSAAIRDILTDPDVEDVAGSIALAQQLSKRGRLAALYAPRVPAKKLPNGDAAPARCPICGCVVCPSCACSCECADDAYEKPEPAPAP